ncbi:MAG: hypothetical protein LJE87_02985 [Deltaproteobacteria bacterium]|nr:hypothetical protein [Deltaproteobacteria bacterium]
MKGLIQIEIRAFAFSNTPVLQHSSTSKQLNTTAYQLVRVNMNVCNGVGKGLSNLSVDPRVSTNLIAT